MPSASRLYPYVGPSELRECHHESSGAAITSQSELAAWLGCRDGDELADPFMFIVNTDGDLRMAPPQRARALRRWP